MLTAYPRFARLNFLGQCGRRILCGLLCIPLTILHNTIVLCKDILHGILRILRLFYRVLAQPIHLHREEASRIYADWQTVKTEPNPVRIRTMSKRLLHEFFGKNGWLLTMLRYLAPICCIAFLFMLVKNAVRTDYGIELTLNGEKIGCIEQESDFDTAEQIVRERLSYTEKAPKLSFAHSLQLVPNNDGELYLNAYTLADKMLAQSGVSLSEGFGVYKNEEFLGAVADKLPIENALADQLAAYTLDLPHEVEDVYYSDEISYVEGLYLTESLVNEDDVIDKLTRVADTTAIYKALGNDTLYDIAERYSTTIEQLQELNPELPILLKSGMEVTVPTQERSLPISYTLQKETLSFIDYDTVNINTAELPVGKTKIIQRGEKGQKRNDVRQTFVNGVLAKTALLHSTLISQPVNEQVGVGTYTPAPASKSTVLLGSGEYNWPVNGGRISDTFISNRNHRGIDIAAPEGTEIYAAADGVVTVAKFNSSYGNYVMIDHGDGRQTLYAHASRLLVGTEMHVKRGQLIALVGTTGHSTGNHLHFEVRIDGVNYDPAAFLRVNAE